MVAKRLEVTVILIAIFIVLGISIIPMVLFHLPAKYYPRPEFLKIEGEKNVRQPNQN